MIIYDYLRSSAAFRLRSALNLKGIAPERRYVHLANDAQRSAEYLAVNPQGLVPYMIDDDGFEFAALRDDQVSNERVVDIALEVHRVADQFRRPPVARSPGAAAVR